jgi:hypothetical protein
MMTVPGSIGWLLIPASQQGVSSLELRWDRFTAPVSVPSLITSCMLFHWNRTLRKPPPGSIQCIAVMPAMPRKGVQVKLGDRQFLQAFYSLHIQTAGVKGPCPTLAIL